MREWESTGPGIFWGEVTPCEHLVQIYEDDDVFLDTLAGFAGGGLQSGDGVIIIATDTHLEALASRLIHSGIDIGAAKQQDRYIPVDAEELLSRLVFRGWPDDYLFKTGVTGLLARASRGGRRVRAFGEMVAILWARGQNAATVRLEHLWQGICRDERLSLFCAYPRSGFTQDANTSIQELCALHSRIVAA
ncbi:MAG TPA: MEDS domain-containing protein [Gemmatimonadales bacterium]|nr:MEDS domain-containing protein [Gemmatimonadales bacterium]